MKFFGKEPTHEVLGGPSIRPRTVDSLDKDSLDVVRRLEKLNDKTKGSRGRGRIVTIAAIASAVALVILGPIFIPRLYNYLMSPPEVAKSQPATPQNVKIQPPATPLDEALKKQAEARQAETVADHTNAVELAKKAEVLVTKIKEKDGQIVATHGEGQELQTELEKTTQQLENTLGVMNRVLNTEQANLDRKREAMSIIRETLTKLKAPTLMNATTPAAPLPQLQVAPASSTPPAPKPAPAPPSAKPYPNRSKVDPNCGVVYICRHTET